MPLSLLFALCSCLVHHSMLWFFRHGDQFLVPSLTQPSDLSLDPAICQPLQLLCHLAQTPVQWMHFSDLVLWTNNGNENSEIFYQRIKSICDIISFLPNFLLYYQKSHTSARSTAIIICNNRTQTWKTFSKNRKHKYTGCTKSTVNSIKVNTNSNVISEKCINRCASGCVVECRICNWEVAGSNLGQGYFAPRTTQPSIPPRLVNENQL